MATVDSETPLTMEALMELVESIPPLPPMPDIRIASSGLDALRVPPDSLISFAGVPVTVDPFLPPGCIAVVGPERPFDPGDPLRPVRDMRISQVVP